MIDDYFKWIVNLLEQSPVVQTPDIAFDRRDDEIGFIRGDVVFKDGSRLHFREYVRQQAGRETERYMYVYHYQGMDGKMIFRFDDAGHYPGLNGFPHHKHLASEEIFSAEPPSLESVLNEIESLIAD
jgi:hypothetical protein